MKKVLLVLCLILIATVVLGEKAATLSQLLRPGEIIFDGDDCIVTDGIKVYIYSKKDFKLKKEFGKRGPGPREFLMPPEHSVYITVYPGFSLIQSRWKISYFTRDGEYIKETRIKPNIFFYRELGDKFIGLQYLDNLKGDKKLYYGVNLYDSNVERVKELHRFLNNHQPSKGTLNDLAGNELFYVYHNKVFIPHKSTDTVLIDVFDNNGNPLYSIKERYKPVRVNDSHKKQLLHRYKTFYKDEYEELKRMTVFPKYLPVVRKCTLTDNKIYIMTYKYTKDKNEFLIFDIKGKFLEKLMVPFKHYTIMFLFPYTIDKGKIYQLVENEKTEKWDLHVTPIE